MDSRVREIIHLLDGLTDEAVDKVGIFIAGMRASKSFEKDKDKPSDNCEKSKPP